MIFLGPPGTGKTSTALILSKKLNNESILELNASDNRGLEFISNEVINFCKKKVDDEMKMIIFDEADNITDKA
jgi:DNA polymerase III delta prime subunit